MQALSASTSEPPDGFIIEHHTAGGHNANPVGPLHLDTMGQPIYSRLDDPDLAAIRNIGLPFWMAGGYGSHAQLLAAQAAGASYVAFGGFYPSKVKQYAVTTQPSILRHAREVISVPLCVIGGMTPHNAAPLVAEGAQLVAAITSVYLAEDVAAAVREFQSIISPLA